MLEIAGDESRVIRQGDTGDQQVGTVDFLQSLLLAQHVELSRGNGVNPGDVKVTQERFAAK